MPDLIAQGARREHRWKRRVPQGQVVAIGRDSDPWSVRWDDHVSRQHVKIRWDKDALHVEALPRTKNPVYFQGVEVKSFRLKPGEHFVIGKTTFTVTDESVDLSNHSRPPATEQTFSQEYLRHLPFRDPGNRLAVISQLPEEFAAVVDRRELLERVLRVIFRGIPEAGAAAICTIDPATEKVTFEHWDQTDAKAVRASRGLIAKSIQTQQSVVHTWDEPLDSSEFTAVENLAWAFCVPFSIGTGESFAIYVAGDDQPSDRAQKDASELGERMKFAEIVSSTVGSICEAGELRKRQSALGQFFSDPVIKALECGNVDDALAPREVDVTVLFCDLRGFSRTTEQFADDLRGLLQRVSDALGVLTKWILHEGGVIGDFHGDAAMGFWGWPLAQDDAAVRAANAALAINSEFRKVAADNSHSLNSFRIGVGIASGRVVAGKIGTVDQVKVTAFGPAVNLASRLEGMTKWLNSSILVDAETADRLRGCSDEIRLRRLAVVQPYGMQSSIAIHELLPSVEQYPLLTDEHIGYYEKALTAFLDGDWKTAWEELHRVPAADPSKDFLTTFIASRNRMAPPDWDGVIRLDAK